MLKNGRTNGMDGTHTTKMDAVQMAGNMLPTSTDIDPRLSANKALLKALNGTEMSDWAVKQFMRETNFDKVLVWDKPEKALREYDALCRAQPLRSIVIHIEPAVAACLLTLCNKKNRDQSRRQKTLIEREIRRNEYVVTGATLVAADTGRLLDGQHRLEGCVGQQVPIVSHFVFGLPESVFDKLDQGKKRTAGEVLKQQGHVHANILAAAVRWVMWYEAGASKVDDMSITHEVRAAAEGRFKGVGEYIHLGNQIAKAYKDHAPSMIAAILYLIQRHGGDRGKVIAENFANDWLNGNRTGIARNFDVLASRIRTVKSQSGGSLNRFQAMAMIIITFNNWHAGIQVTPVAVTWRKELAFPKMELDAAAFRKAREKTRLTSQSLVAQQERIVDVMLKHIGNHDQVSMSFREIAAATNIQPAQVPEIMRSLQRNGKLRVIKKGGPTTTTVYRLMDI